MLRRATSFSRRSVVCHYETPAATKPVAEANVPNSTLMPYATTTVPPCLDPGDFNLLGNVHPSVSMSFMPTGLLSSSLVAPTQVDGALHFRICEIIRAYGKYVDDITVIYFQGVHRWLPIISRPRFHDRLVVLQSPASVDFSILLLSMCLITHNPVCTSHRP